jgi:tetratricopeptide (TPR) repeat protein
MDHREIIYLIFGYSLTAVFVFTAIVTCLSLIGWVSFASKRQQRSLFAVLVIEAMVGGVGIAFGWLKYDTGETVRIIEDRLNNENFYKMSPAASELFEDGKRLFEVNPRLAEEKFSLAELIHPQNYKILLNLGVTRLALGNSQLGAENISQAYRIFEQLPVRPMEERLVILNSLVAAYSRTGKFNQMHAILDSREIVDLADSLIRIYINASNGMIASANWNQAVEVSQKARWIAKAFSNQELEYKSAVNETSALLKIPGSESIAIDMLNSYIADIQHTTFGSPQKAIFKANLLNVRGLFMLRGSHPSPELALDDFSTAIEGIQAISQLHGEISLLASLYGNRADAYAYLERFPDAIKDWKAALRLYVQADDKEGISRQLSELGRYALEQENRDSDAYALLAASIMLGGNKTAADRQEDETLIARAMTTVTDLQKTTIRKHLSDHLEKETEIQGSLWKATYSLP